MSGRFSFRHRLVQCPRCRRPVAADSPVCPHCDYHRMPKKALASRLPAPGHAPEHRVTARSSERPARRSPLRALLVIVMALLAISGYVSLRESGLETRLKSLSSHHWLGATDEQPNSTPEDEAARTKRPNEATSL